MIYVFDTALLTMDKELYFEVICPLKFVCDHGCPNLLLTLYCLLRNMIGLDEKYDEFQALY